MKILLFVLLVLNCAGCRHEAKDEGAVFRAEDVPNLTDDTQSGDMLLIQNGEATLSLLNNEVSLKEWVHIKNLHEEIIIQCDKFYASEDQNKALGCEKIGKIIRRKIK